MRGLARALPLAALAGLLALATASAALARVPGEHLPVPRGADGDIDVRGGHQHGGVDGHLPASSENVEVVGKLELTGTEGRVADVGTLGDYAYLAAFREPCTGFGELDGGGVYIVDVSDPANPEEVGFVPTAAGSFVGEGVHVIEVETPAFRGDLLAFNNEICALSGTQVGGMTLVDVSDPLAPEVLAEGVGDTDPGGFVSAANQIHSVFVWQQGTKAYAVIVDDEETTDVDIFDISDPRHPVQIAETGLEDWPDAQDEQANGFGSFAASLFHDVVVKRIRGEWLMLLSYWDAGYVILDVDDPANPVFVGDTTFAAIDPETGLTPEGNAHEAEWSHDNRFILATDEDFSPYRAADLEVTVGGDTEISPSEVVGGAAAPAILADKTLNGRVVYGGYGCPAIDGAPASAPIPRPEDVPGYLPVGPNEETIVVLQRGPVDDPSAPEPACFPGEKAHSAVEAGWDTVLFVNRHTDPDVAFCGSGGFEDEIVGICTDHATYHRLFGTVNGPYPDNPPLGTIGGSISVGSIFDGWGYLHLFDASTLEDLDTYAIPESLDETFADGFGDLSIHEITTDSRRNLGYISYYSGGFRVVRFGRGGIEEVGHFIDEGGNNLWGVQLLDSKGSNGRHRGKHPIVLASDRDFGLYLLRYTGR